MWVKMITELLGMGQENTQMNQQNQMIKDQQLANVLFGKQRNNQDTYVILGIFLIIGVVLYIAIKGN